MYKEAREAFNTSFKMQKKDDADDSRIDEGKKLYEEIKNKN